MGSFVKIMKFKIGNIIAASGSKFFGLITYIREFEHVRYYSVQWINMDGFECEYKQFYLEKDYNVISD